MRLTGILLIPLGLCCLRAPARCETEAPPSLVLNPKTMEARYRFAVGASYTGMQLRYHLGSRYAMELRLQTGTADSAFGEVHSDVYGLRLQRFIPYRSHWAWYLGGEAAYAKSEVWNSTLKVKGFAAGAFGGMEYRVLPRVAIGADIGPYVISLREETTRASQSSLDFVVNTAINFYLF